MSGSVGKAAKPQLRGLLHQQIKRNILLAAAVATAAAVVQKVFVNNPRMQVYADFYKTYDIEKTFHQMRNKGLFDSCEPDN
ncbi:unnamed protein product [Acanthoscelides obtectus]|uniref:Mitochondrial cytochrome c oxidase subunit VIc/VIIs domain-containing protein n=1 Tax=Acanthoscelides obtectus TaxID=200917 RepID=A0A9P0JWV5_ACAOB|nr:unnamed protein product [Acanthoscelides obtectus]CAK1641111.1 Cytochrome c oxidase subunit 6C [Acanthoscelides obtectus]